MCKISVAITIKPSTQGLQKKFRASGHSGSVRAVAIHHQWLATGSTDETIRCMRLFLALSFVANNEFIIPLSGYIT